MGVSIDGWVEYCTPFQEELGQEDHGQTWQTLMAIPALVQFNDEVSWILWGHPRDFHNPFPQYVPLFTDRGIPTNTDWVLKASERNARQWVETGEVFGHTHGYYDEIKAIPWQANYGLDPFHSDWGKLFALLDHYCALRQFEPHQIRLTVWYSW